MATNLASAVVKDVLTGMPRRTELEVAALMDTCKACEQFRASDKRCAKCGCYLTLKLWMAGQHCPLGKW